MRLHLFIRFCNMKRELKFRVWDNVSYMSKPFTMGDAIAKVIEFTDDCVVMQYTGRRDINGQEIYEGDIVYHGESIREVIYYLTNWVLKRGEDGILLSFSSTPRVIGNIYENPELLKKD